MAQGFGAGEEALPMQVRSTLWQRGFAFLLFVFFGGMSVCATLTIYFPAHPLHIKIPSPAETWGGAAIVFGIGFYLWWQTERWQLSADEDVVVQHTGFATTRVRYEEVAACKWKRLSNSTQVIVEPVLYGKQNNLLLRPAAPLIAASAKHLRERERFWRLVTERVNVQHLERPFAGK